MKKILLLFACCLMLVVPASAITFINYTVNASDGNIYRVAVNSTFTDLRNGAGTGYDATGATTASYVRSDLATDRYARIYRTALIFDTSGLPDDAVISAATVGLYRFQQYTDLGDTGLNIVKFNIDGTISADDYDNFEVSRYSSDQSASTITTAKYYNWSLNAIGIENISKTGNTGLGSRFGFDIDNTSPTWVAGGSKYSGAAWRPADYVAYPPFIEITYSIPPVAAFSANETAICTNDYVQFTDESTNTPTAWHWIVSPSGWDSHSQNPVHQFDTAGTYMINLTASNAAGSDEESKPNYITVTDCGTPTPSTSFSDWPWCEDQDIFFRNDSSDIAGYFHMDHRPQIESTKYLATTVSSATGSKQIGAWATNASKPGVSAIGPGLWRFRVYLNVSSAVGNTNYEFKVFNRSSDGTETDLFYGQVISKDINDLTPTEHLISYARRNYTQLFSGDRLVIKVNASTSSVAARDAWMSVAGNTQASMVGVSYFICEDTISSGSNGGGEAVGAAFGIAGGIIGGLIILRRSKP